MVFQYDSRLTAVSYLSRTVEVAGQTIAYRKIKDEILVDLRGITRKGNVNEAIPERAFLDTLYLNPSYCFDNVHPLDEKTLRGLLPIYQSKTLTQRVNKILEDGNTTSPNSH